MLLCISSASAAQITTMTHPRFCFYLSVLRFVFIIKAIFTILEDEDVIFMKATMTLKFILITDLDIVIVTFYDFYDWSDRLVI